MHHVLVRHYHHPQSKTLSSQKVLRALLPKRLQNPFPTWPDLTGFANWGLNEVNAPEVWNNGYTGEGVTVAIVDTGIDLDHPDLVSNLWVNPGEIAGNGIDDDGNGFIDDIHGYDFNGNDANPNDFNGHGTHVAGTVASASNSYGSTGVAYDASIMAVQVLSASGSGSMFDVAAGIIYAVDNGASPKPQNPFVIYFC